MLTYFRRRKYRLEVWAPTILLIDDEIKEFYSEDALDEMPEIDLTFEEEKSKSNEVLGQKAYVYAPQNTIKKSIMEDSLLQNAISVCKNKRTTSITKHLTVDLREAIDAISIREILYDIDPLFTFQDNKKTSSQKYHEKMIEDLHYDGKLHSIFKEIKTKFGDRKADSRTRADIDAFIKTHYQKFLKRDGGILQIISKSQLKLIDLELKSWFIPHRPHLKVPNRLHDWKLFFIIDTTDEIVRVASVTQLKIGIFNKFKKNNRFQFKMKKMKLDDSIKIIEDWVRGIGGVKNPKKRKGGSLPVIMINFNNYYSSNSIECDDSDLKTSKYKFISIKKSREYYHEYINS